MTDELTAEEKRAIASLKRLASKWPKTLWLFSANGSLLVMRTDENGERVTRPTGGIDPDFAVADIDIPNDGGDW